MGKECVIFGCTNRDTDMLPGVKFHRIPSAEPRRSMWIKAINRKDCRTGKDWSPGDKTARICSEHFIEGKSDDINSPDYVPTVNLGYRKSKTPSIDRYNRATARSVEKERRSVKRKLETSNLQAAEALMDLSNLPGRTDMVEEGDKENSADDTSRIGQHDTCIKLIARGNMKEKQLHEELIRLQTENEELKHRTTHMRAKHLVSSDRVLFYTGLPSHAAFVWLVSFVTCVLPVSEVLGPADILLLVLMKLRLNVPQKDLAYRFGVSLSFVSVTLDAALPRIADKLKFLVRWPMKEEILKHRPQCFKETFPKCVSIIDCTEVFIEAPSNFSARAATYSNYKHTNTLKFLISITPSGSISFVSRAFCGRTSDKIISSKSGYLDKIENGDVVLADRGFLIRDELASRGAELLIPAFLKGKHQLSAREVETSRKMSRVRIHVERMMERLKNFRILSDRMSISMVPHADNVMTICAAITNLHPKLVQ